MNNVLRLRFKVYCEEKRYLSSECFPHGMEFDEFDHTATHFIVYGDDPLPVGYMRVVKSQDVGGFPLFSHGLEIKPEFTPPPASASLETSRMIVRTDFRHGFRFPSDGFSSSGEMQAPPTRTASDLIQLKLLRLAYRNALEGNIRWFYAAMELSLARKMNRMGFPFKTIGPMGDYLGAVLPHIMDLREMELELQNKHPFVWSFFDNPAEDIHSRIVRPGEWALPTILDTA